MDVWKERSSHTYLPATEFGVVASPQGQPGTGVKALPCMGAAEGPLSLGNPSEKQLGHGGIPQGSCSFLKNRRDTVPVPEFPHLW